MTTVSCPKKSQLEYKLRRPEKTPFFQVIKKHFNTWCRQSVNPIPGYISKEFTSFLGCGILAKGFACALLEKAVIRIFSLLFLVRGGEYALLAIRELWWKQQRIW